MSNEAYRIKDIEKIVGGNLIKFSSNNSIRNLILDSRKLISPEESLFFAIKGQRHDGHNFLQELYRKGVRNFIISGLSENIDLLFDANVIKVEDALDALQKLAAYHQKQFGLKTIGITGSNGKTIIKEWLYQLLQDEYSIVRSPKSYNSQIGVPLSIWNMRKKHTLGIFEAGISEPGEMERLEKIIHPGIGIFTNLGAAHQENFQSPEEKAAEKLKLFRNSKKLIYCADHKIIQKVIEEDEAFQNIDLIKWSAAGNKAEMEIISREQISKGSKITGRWKGEEISIRIPFADNGSVENAIHCWVLMLSENYDHVTIAERMMTLAPVAMRLELLDGINGCSVINDVYNSDLNSLEIALDFMNQQKQHQKKTVILSDILQSGLDNNTLFTHLESILRGKNIKRLIGIGHEISQFKGKFQEVETEFYPDTDTFLETFSTERFRNENILVKGARKFEFEKISALLQQKAHETVLEVNLNALVNNLNYFKSQIRPSTKLMAMVKAFSYGTGSFEIANILEFHHVDYLAVAYADEGVDLRKAGITLPIVVMNPQTSGYDVMVRYNLEPEIYNLRTLRGFIKSLQGKDTSKAYPVHIKLDTGMHRLGFEKGGIPDLLAELKKNPEVKVASIFSHLAASDDKSLDKYSNAQIELFTEMAEMITKALPNKPLLHILNSAGISRFPGAQFDMVRLGIGLYGIGTPKEKKHLQQVSRLKTIISQIKSIPKGDSVGYGRSVVSRESIIAILPIGYADGLTRNLGNGKGCVWINDFKAPFIGNICMDMCMVDVTTVPCKEGDEVIIFNEEHPISELASSMGTIPYEALTAISGRVKRIYFQE